MNRKDVAKLAGVSEATVSRVMNNVGPIKNETREKVMKAAAELGYELNALAQQLARRKSGNIGVVLPHVPKVHLFSTYYFSEILSGIAEVAKRSNMDLLMIFQDPSDKRDYSRLFRSKKIDACIILGAIDTPEERKAIQELVDQAFPFCIINQRFQNDAFIYVDGDHEKGSFEAVKHLIEKGCQKIAFMNGPKQYSNSIDRYEGYCTSLEAAGIDILPEWLFEGNYSRKSGYNIAPQMAKLIQNNAIDGIFSANDRMAIGLMEGLSEYGLEAGVHYRIVGYDDSDSAKIVSPKLTSVAVPFYNMGVKAASMLLEKETEDEPLQHCILPVSLVVRQSS